MEKIFIEPCLLWKIVSSRGLLGVGVGAGVEITLGGADWVQISLEGGSDEANEETLAARSRLSCLSAS